MVHDSTDNPDDARARKPQRARDRRRPAPGAGRRRPTSIPPPRAATTRTMRGCRTSWKRAARSAKSRWRPATRRSSARSGSPRPRPASIACSARMPTCSMSARPRTSKSACPTMRAPECAAAGAHPAHDRGHGDRGDHLDHDRDRSAAAGGQPHQAAAAALQRAAARRQIVSLYPDHRRPLGAADPEAPRRAVAARALFRPVRLRRRRQPHHHGLAARVPDPLLHGFFFESRSRPCLLYQIRRCAGPCTREIDFPGYTTLVREATDFLSGKSQAVKQELAGEMEKASGELEFESAALYRDRLAALSAIQSQQGINPRTVEEADVFAIHQEGGFSCVEVFFFRTGQNWGNRAYFPRAEKTYTPEECWAPSSPSSTTTSRRRDSSCSRTRSRRASCLPSAVDQGRPQGRGHVAQARREEGARRPRADQCARGARPQARGYRDPEPPARRHGHHAGLPQAPSA